MTLTPLQLNLDTEHRVLHAASMITHAAVRLQNKLAAVDFKDICRHVNELLLVDLA